MKGLWLALLLMLFCPGARAQAENPIWLQADGVTMSAIKKQTGLSLHWAGDSAPDLLWSLSIFAGEERVLRLLAVDGLDRKTMGWRPDLDPAPGMLKIRLDELWLAPGVYDLKIDLPDGRSQEFALWIEEASPGAREVSVDLPMDVTRLKGWRTDPVHGHHAYTWWPVPVPGRALLSLSETEWTLQTDGAGDSLGTRVVPGVTKVEIQEIARDQRIRTLVENRNGWILLGVIPICLAFCGLGSYRLWQTRNSAGLQGALAMSIGVGLMIVEPVLTDPGAFMLGTTAEDSAGMESVARLATMSSALWELSAHGNAFSWPDGHSWLGVEPGWLGYLIPTLFSVSTDPITAHNLALAVGTSLLCFFSWALMRTLGASQAGSLMGATAAALSPIILDDLDAQGLDQSCLFLLPLFMLLLHRSLRREGWMNPLLAGTTLAATCYAHRHIGPFLFLSTPLMMLWRLPGGGIKKRLARAGVLLATGFFLLTPSWLLGQLDDSSSSAEPEIRLIDSTPNIFKPFSDQTSRQRLLEAEEFNSAATDPLERLASTVGHSTGLSELMTPTDLLVAGGLFWPMALLSVAVARRRVLTAVVLADVALFLLLSLGPFLRMEAGRIGPALPFYGAWLVIPGFDRLVEVDQFLRMAAVLAPVPLALALDGGMDQVANLWARVLHASRLRTLGGQSRFSPFLAINRLVEPFVWQFKYAFHGPILIFLIAIWAGFSLSTKRIGMGEEESTGISTTAEPWTPPWPEIRRIPRHPGLKGLPKGSAIALPVMKDTQASVYLPLVRAGIALVNPPPPGIQDTPSAQRQSDLPSITRWVDENPLLNHLAWVSGSDGPSRFLSYDPDQASLYTQNLLETGLDYIIMFRSHMPSGELTFETEHALDELYPRVKDDGRVAVWAIRPVEDL
jgi:hypothetical protein